MEKYSLIRPVPEQPTKRAADGASARVDSTASLPVQAVLLAMQPSDSQSHQPPHIHQTLPVAERLHQRIVGRAARGKRIDCPELTGQHANGQPLQQNHQHAHILPLDLDGDQYLDHVLIWAPMGLGTRAQQAIKSLQHCGRRKSRRRRAGIDHWQISVVGYGGLQTLRWMPQPLAHSTRILLGLGGEDQVAERRDSVDTRADQAAGERIWTSLTPFVPARYLKRRGKNSLEGQIQAELESRGLPQAQSIDVLILESTWAHNYVTARRLGGRPPAQNAAFALRLELSRPAPGPIALGYASHFGLGLFQSQGDQG